MSDERPFGPWDCDRLRASVFRAPNEEFAASSHAQWWNEAVGRQFLQSMEDRPSDGVVTYTGNPRHGGQLVMDVRADRVDWFLQPGGATDVPPGALMTIRDELLSDFRGTVERWLALIEPASLTRLAFGANLVSQVATEAEAHDELARIIEFGRELYSPDVSDFLFRINRPRKMHGSGITMNRLVAWSAMTFGYLEIAVGPGGPAGHPRQFVGYARRLELDINTATVAGQLPRSGLSSLFGELVDAGAEIAKEGDTR